MGGIFMQTLRIIWLFNTGLNRKVIDTVEESEYFIINWVLFLPDLMCCEWRRHTGHFFFFLTRQNVSRLLGGPTPSRTLYLWADGSSMKQSNRRWHGSEIWRLWQYLNAALFATRRSIFLGMFLRNRCWCACLCTVGWGERHGNMALMRNGEKVQYCMSKMIFVV